MEDHFEHGIERREFIARCGSVLQAIMLAGVAAPMFQACETSQVLAPRPTDDDPVIVDVDVRALDADGKFLVLNDVGPNRESIIVVRKDASTFLALSMTCTHQGCKVNNPAGGVIHCNCHGSEYDMDGAVLEGPAPAPLPRYAVAYDAARSLLSITVVP